MTDRMTELFLAIAAGPSRYAALDEMLSSTEFPAELRQAASALRQEMVHARQQREATRILVDAATLITAARDVEEALDLVCRRSKILLNSDMAYISLNDLASRETFIHTTDGVVTPRYRQLRMPLGTGILGQAAGGATVAQTNGYIGDPSFPHIEAVDAAVLGEGVVSILAVTMRVGGERLGALLVADRHRREYTPSEVDLLTQIAGLAAVALQRAKQLEELMAMLDERDKARAEAETRNGLLQRIEHLDQAMFEILRAEEAPAELARLVGETIGSRVEVLHPSDLEGHRPPDVGQLFEHDCLRSLSGRATLATAVSGQRILGALEAHQPLDRDQRFLFERASAVLTAMILAEERGWATDLQTQHQLVRDLEAQPAAAWRSLAGQLARYRLQEGATVRVLALRTERPADARSDLRELMTRRGGITSIRRGVLRVLSANLSGRELHDQLSARGHRSAVAELETTLTPEDVPSALRTVQRTVRAMEALNLTGVADPRWDLGLAGLAIAELPAATVDLLVRRTLRPLLDYDSLHGTDLVFTAWEFLEADMHSVRTAGALHIHPNTLRQRVQRIEAILGSGWRSGSRRADIHLALRLWRLQPSGAQT